MKALNEAEQQRYQRHFNLPNFGERTQQKLKDSKILVVGAGGLSCPMLQYLVAAGVGEIAIMDDDVVSMSNLHRQILYTEEDIGQSKVLVAKKKLQKLNPHCRITAISKRLTSANALSIIENYEVVADGTDNFPTRYLVNDACVILGKTNVFAAIYQYEGQLAVFNYPLPDASNHSVRSAHYRHLFPNAPAPGMIPDCATGGVLGVLPGIMGALQANEVIKVLTGIGEVLYDTLFILDTQTMMTRKLKFKNHPEIRIDQLIDYEDFCGITNSTDITPISPREWEMWQAQKEDFILLDVREPEEYIRSNIGGINIPLSNIENFDFKKIEWKGKKVVIACQRGNRSKKAIQYFKEKGRETDFYNLEGGLSAYQEHLSLSSK